MPERLYNPLVTFLVPCYNYGRYLDACVSSMLMQTYRRFEVLILDDCSSDNTRNVALDLACRDTRVRYYRQKANVGHLANYNCGLEQAAGQLVWLISADDCLASATVLADLVAPFGDYDAIAYAFCRAQIIDEKGRPQEQTLPRADTAGLPDAPQVIRGHDFFIQLIQGNGVAAPAVLARKACYERTGLFHPALTHSGDWYNWLAFTLSGDVFFDPAAKVYYRKHATNMHRSYQDPVHAVENTLLCYEEIEALLARQAVPARLRWAARLAKIRYRRRQGLRLTPGERALRLSARILEPFF